MAGLYFEDFKVGQEFAHPLTRTVTEMDNTLFSLLTLNPQPLHIDAHFSATTEFGQRLFNSLYTLGIMIGMTVYETTMGTTVANLGMTDVNFPKPVFHGDTLTCDDQGDLRARIQSRGRMPVSSNSDTRRSIRTTRSSRLPPYGADAQKARLMRSMLFVPGDSPRKFEKAAKSNASALILDLEDFVAPDKKEEARGLTRSMLESRRRSGSAVCAGQRTRHRDDVERSRGDDARRPNGIVLPKCRGRDDVRQFISLARCF